jgi:hypothetical protein
MQVTTECNNLYVYIHREIACHTETHNEYFNSIELTKKIMLARTQKGLLMFSNFKLQ